MYLNQRLVNMENQSHQSTIANFNDGIKAKKFLKRLCKAISNIHEMDVQCITYPDGMASIISKNNEVGLVVYSNGPNKAFFKSTSDLANALLLPGSILNFTTMEISISQDFGHTLEEIMIKFDLMKV